MPNTKPAPRGQPTPEKTDPRAPCAAEAARQVAERDRLFEARRPLVAHYNAFVAALDSLRAVRGDLIAEHFRGNPGPLEAQKAIGGELDRTAKELNALADAAQYPIALPGETVEAATLRIAIERGINPTQWAKLERSSARYGEDKNSTERRDARKALAKHLPRYRADIETYRDLVRLARMGDVASLHQMRRHTFNAEHSLETAIEKWEHEIARLEEVIERATPRHGRPPKVAPGTT